MTVASSLLATAAMSAGSVMRLLDLHPALSAVAFGLAIAALAVGVAWERRAMPALDRPTLDRAGRALVALAVAGAVAGRHLFVASSAVAPDDALAAVVVVGAAIVPPGPRWRAAGAALALATYVVVGATLIAFSPYRSDAVAATHGGAELLLAGRHPYADFDMVERLRRFGLPPEFATPLEDGTRLRSLNYPALAVIAPAPFVAAGLSDVRALYLAVVLAIFALVIGSTPPPWRAFALAACIGNLVVLGQFVLAGVDPIWALLVIAAWQLRARAASAALLGLALADRQLAWLVAPFVIAWSWRRFGPRAALTRSAIALAVALLVHIPFLVTAPGAVLGGITDVVLLPLEPRGVGPAGAGAATFLPRWLFLAAATLAYLAALWALASGRLVARTAPLALPLLPLWLSWRALQSYFAFAPLLLLLSDAGEPSSRGPRGTARSAPDVPRIVRRVGSDGMPVDKELLEILACPVDHAPVREEGDRLVCSQCGRRYPVRDGIPVMLVEEAELPEQR